MNTFYDKNRQSNSNSRIFQAYYGESAKAPSRRRMGVERLLAWLFSLYQTLVESRVCRIARVLTFSVGLIAILGVVGAMERGTLGLGLGLTVSLILIGIEYLCLRIHRA